MSEITTAQTVGSVSSFMAGMDLVKIMPATYATYRKMRTDPTIALARHLSIAPIVAAEWSLDVEEGTPDDWVKLIEDAFMPIREPLLETALLGGLDFGWQPYEKVFGMTEDGQLTIKKFKPLLHDITTIMVTQDTGAFAGFKQRTTVEVPLDNSLLIPFRVEGSNWYGNSLLENVRSAYNDWLASNAGAMRYDKKIAGSHWVMHYPVGETGGKDNAEIATDLMRCLESSGAIKIPYDPTRFTKETDISNMYWKIELISDSGPKQTSFVNRQKYLDTNKVRGLLVPERAILEGQFGTKAEAGQHADLAITNMELLHRHVVRHLNWHAVDQLLFLNWGQAARGSIKIAAAPLADEKLAWMREVYLAILSNPGGFLVEFDGIDRVALKESLDIPIQKDPTGDEPAIDEIDDDETDVDDADAAVAKAAIEDARA